MRGLGGFDYKLNRSGIVKWRLKRYGLWDSSIPCVFWWSFGVEKTHRFGTCTGMTTPR